MKKIKFTSGTLTKFVDEYYTLVLFNGDKQVYTSTETRLSAAKIINDYNNIKLI